MKVGVIGVLDHWAVNRASLCLMSEQVETGATHIIGEVHRTLRDWVCAGPLPHTAFIQMAACSGENENKFTPSYSEYLVEMGVFLPKLPMYNVVPHLLRSNAADYCIP